MKKVVDSLNKLSDSVHLVNEDIKRSLSEAYAKLSLEKIPGEENKENN